MEEWLLLSTLGVVVGAFSALFGVGGGVLIVPLLPLAASLSVRETIATSLFAILLVVVNNTQSFHRRQVIDWKVALRVGPMTAVGSYTAGWATRWLSPVFLKYLLATLLLVFVIRAWLGIRDISQAKGKNIIAGAVGVLAGLASGLSGVGSGVILSPFMMALRLVEHTRVSPTANAIMCFTTSFGALAFVSLPAQGTPWQWGQIHVDKALVLVLGAWFSSYYARRYQPRVPEKPRRRILLAVLFLLSLKVFWDAYRLQVGAGQL